MTLLTKLYGLLAVLLSCVQSEYCTVNTRLGPLKGNKRTSNYDIHYEEYLNIPFAKPPVGDLRFHKPVPAEPWVRTRDATEFGNHCIQIISPVYAVLGIGGHDEEDCLYLNIYVPRGIEHAKKKILPVMVWHCGGAFVLGTGAMYPGGDLATHGDVIVVTFNYRVGALGFLSTGDEHSPGNYGLWDAHMAVKWVHDNIDSFGGDPKRITLFGNSAGGSLVSNSALSPHFDGMVHRVIAMAGGSTSAFGVMSKVKAVEVAESLASSLSCEVKDREEMMKCLREADADDLDLFGLLTPILHNNIAPPFMPVVDGDLIPHSPRESWKEGRGGQVDFMTGYGSQDFAGFVALTVLGIPAFFGEYGFAGSQELVDTMIRLPLNLYHDQELAFRTLRERYPGMKNDEVMFRALNYTQSCTDWLFDSPCHFEALQHATSSALSSKSTYYYEYAHRQNFFRCPDWMSGGNHVDDMYSLFGQDFFDVPSFVLGDWSRNDLDISKDMMSYWTNFAHTGNPNQGPNRVPKQWPQYDSRTRQFMHINHQMEVLSESEAKREMYDFFDGHWQNVTSPSQRFAPEPPSSRVSVVEVMDTVVQKVEELASVLPDVVMEIIKEKFNGALRRRRREN